MQRAVLLRTREKLDELQRAVAELEVAARPADAAAATEPPPWDCALVHSRARAGVRAPRCGSKCTVGGGLPRCRSSACRRPRCAKPRIACARRSSARSSNFPTRRITVNLAPADLPKDGGRFDLPIALGILAASGQIAAARRCATYEFLGELGLTGELRAVDGVLPAALAAARSRTQADRAAGQRRRSGAGRVGRGRHRAHAAGSLRGAGGHARRCRRAVARRRARRRGAGPADVRGQAHARRALEIAAAGGTTCCSSARPGCGKTLLASRLPGLLPEASEAEALEAAAIASVSGRGCRSGALARRARSARRTTRASAVALVGGGADPRPGRDLARAQRRAVPRRAAGMGPARAAKCCASRWNRAWSPSRARRGSANSRRASSWSPR